MKVVDIKITPVTVPVEAPLRWSMGVETGTTRGIVQVITDEGIVGIGETYGGNAVEHAIEVAKPLRARAGAAGHRRVASPARRFSHWI